MAIFDTPPRYRTYLLTVWEERSHDPAAHVVWRFRLEDPRTGERRGFAGARDEGHDHHGQPTFRVGP